MLTTAGTTTTRFRTFVDHSRVLLAKRASASSIEPFQHFVAAAARLLLPRIRSLLPNLIKLGTLVHRWLANHDLLAVAGLSHLENPYSELVAWMLAPETHPVTAARRQRAWLRMLYLEDRVDPSRPVPPRTQLVTDDGIPDIVFEYPKCLLVVEAKTRTCEHSAPSGGAQTVAYAKAVPPRLGRTDAQAEHVVFLTYDGDPAENPDAIPTTYRQLVLALATEISPHELLPDLRWAFSTVFTHLLTHTGPAGVDVHTLLGRIAEWGADPTFPESEIALMNELAAILQAIRFFRGSQNHDQTG